LGFAKYSSGPIKTCQAKRLFENDLEWAEESARMFIWVFEQIAIRVPLLGKVYKAVLEERVFITISL
jgi:hypothetical protein